MGKGPANPEILQGANTPSAFPCAGSPLVRWDVAPAALLEQHPVGSTLPHGDTAWSPKCLKDFRLYTWRNKFVCKVFSNDFNMFLFETCNCFLSGLDQSYQLRKFLQTLCAALFLLLSSFLRIFLHWASLEALACDL